MLSNFFSFFPKALHHKKLVEKKTSPDLLISFNGIGNQILNAESVVGKASIFISGNNNKIMLNDGVKINGKITVEGSGNKVLFDESVVFRGRLIVRGNDQEVRLGKSTTFQSVYMLCQEGCNIDIGDWCMFSRDIEIRTTDAHSVVDVQTRERVNKPASVRIGSHVWVGVGSLISKGSQIPNDSIVGAYSFVNKEFTEENVLIAGTPAKIVRNGVTWNRGRKPKFTQAQLEHWKKPPSKTE